MFPGWILWIDIQEDIIWFTHRISEIDIQKVKGGMPSIDIWSNIMIYIIHRRPAIDNHDVMVHKQNVVKDAGISHYSVFTSWNTW